MSRSAAPLALLAVVACGPGGRSANGPPPGAAAPAACTFAAESREPILPGDMVQDLGTLPVGAEASFAVAEGTAAFFIFSQEVGDSAEDTVVFGGEPFPNVVVPTNLRAPDGTLYYDDLVEWPTTAIGAKQYYDVTGSLAYDLAAQPVSGAFPVPNTSAALARGVQPGTWAFTVNDWALECPRIPSCTGGSSSGRYRVHVVTRPAPATESGTLDVEVYLATDPTSVLSTAAAANEHPQVDRWKQSLGHYLANGGISLGEVTFHDLAQEVKDAYAPNGTVDVTDSSPCGSLQRLFTNATAPSAAVHLFLADELVADVGSGPFTVVGVDGSIPGPTGFPGTIYGGAIIGLFGELGHGSSAGACSGAGPDLASCGTDRIAYVAAHEIGHWLGLYHTTEQPGILFDPLSDTARCACFSCAPEAQRDGCYEVAGARWTTSVTNGTCDDRSASCGGGRNLMFWLLDSSVSTGELSGEQGQIMRLNPAVR